ncbi:MAG: hydroxyacid dehydrogenase [Candidatus Schekmanbacteria bacterium]|nr:hydroxyacid dehydrogenase [Candidatus Schekmanbacteria bacterium]
MPDQNRIYKRLGLSGYERTVVSALEPAEVARRGYRYELVECYDEASVIAAAADADVVAVSSTVPISARVAKRLERLRLVIVCTSGYENVDVATLNERGVRVARLAGVRRDEVAEHSLAMAMTLLRRLSLLTRRQADGVWLRSQLGALAPGSVRGAVVGIVGLGVIGTAAARLFSALGATVLGAEIAPTAAENVETVTLPELLNRSAIVSLHVSLTPSARGLFGEETIARMRPGAILINTSRGEVVDEDAVLGALEREHLWGAGLDVFNEEPPVWCRVPNGESSPRADPRDRDRTDAPDTARAARWRALADAGRVVLTPHGAGFSPAMPRALVRDAMAVLDAFVAGLPLPHELGCTPRQ